VATAGKWSVPVAALRRVGDDRARSSRDEEEWSVRVVFGWVCVAVVAVLLAGCGGSDGPETVNRCTIEPTTMCSDANLSGADLSGADLSRATLTKANLEGADLSGADLSEADLSGARIVDADLSDADLTRANLTGATITGTNLEGATLCGTTRTDGTVDDTSCPASTGSTETETTGTGTTASTGPDVTSFDVGDLSCDSGTSASVTVSWTSENATAVEIGVDSSSPAGYGPSGSTAVAVPCDGASHTITITPQSDAGPGAPRSEKVSPE
jgi:hypothetical protein